jgi:hypothetical protein
LKHIGPGKAKRRHPNSIPAATAAASLKREGLRRARLLNVRHLRGFRRGLVEAVRVRIGPRAWLLMDVAMFSLSNYL